MARSEGGDDIPRPECVPRRERISTLLDRFTTRRINPMDAQEIMRRAAQAGWVTYPLNHKPREETREEETC